MAGAGVTAGFRAGSDRAAPFDGKTALIFGGGRNIGRAIALEFARRGARLAVADLDEAGALETAQVIIEGGGAAIGIRTNVMDMASMQDAAARAEAAFGDMHIVVNNAGVIQSGNPEDIPFAEWQRTLDCNFLGIIRSNEIFLPKMLARGSGHLVNTASFAGLYPYASSRAPYAASKAAIVSLSQNLALYLEPKGIRVTCLCPGPTASTIDLRANTFSDSVVNRGPGADLAVLSVDDVAVILADGMRDGKILLPTHPQGYDSLRDWGASPDAFIRGKAEAYEAGETGMPDRRDASPA